MMTVFAGEVIFEYGNLGLLDSYPMRPPPEMSIAASTDESARFRRRGAVHDERASCCLAV